MCADEKDLTQILAYIEENEVLKTFDMTFADYYSTKNKRMMDLPPNNPKALRKVLLIFLQSPHNIYFTRIHLEF